MFSIKRLKVFHISKLTTSRKVSLEAAGGKRWQNPVRPRSKDFLPSRGATRILTAAVLGG